MELFQTGLRYLLPGRFSYRFSDGCDFEFPVFFIAVEDAAAVVIVWSQTSQPAGQFEFSNGCFGIFIRHADELHHQRQEVQLVRDVEIKEQPERFLLARPGIQITDPLNLKQEIAVLVVSGDTAGVRAPEDIVMAFEPESVVFEVLDHSVVGGLKIIGVTEAENE